MLNRKCLAASYKLNSPVIFIANQKMLFFRFLFSYNMQQQKCKKRKKITNTNDLVLLYNLINCNFIKYYFIQLNYLLHDICMIGSIIGIFNSCIAYNYMKYDRFCVDRVFKFFTPHTIVGLLF